MMDGQKYVLDMSGAQYGWQEPVMSWELYSTSRVREIKEEAPFGKTREFCKKRAKSMGPQCEWIQRIGEGFAKNLEEALKSWQKDNKISTVDLLRLPEPEFQKQQASLLDAAKQSLKVYRATEDAQGRFEVEGGFPQHETLDRKFISAMTGMTLS